jgi:hypothetical protein
MHLKIIIIIKKYFHKHILQTRILNETSHNVLKKNIKVLSFEKFGIKIN